MTTSTDQSLQILEEMLGYKPTFGTMLHSIRKCEEMSLSNFAKLLKITPQKLCDIEKGRRIVSPKTAVEFAKILEDSPEYFVIKCLQDALTRDNINMQLSIEQRSDSGYQYSEHAAVR